MKQKEKKLEKKRASVKLGSEGNKNLPLLAAHSFTQENHLRVETKGKLPKNPTYLLFTSEENQASVQLSRKYATRTG